MGRDHENCRRLVRPHLSCVVRLLVDIPSYRVKIQLFTTESLSYTDDRLLHEMENLSRNLNLICQTELFSRWTVNCLTNNEMKELRIFLTSLYHACHIILHAAIVPPFSGRTVQLGFTRNAMRNSYETIFSHATKMGVLLKEYLSTSPDLTKLSPLVGFVAFITGSIVVVSMRSPKNGNTNDKAEPLAFDISLIESCLITLGTLQAYWVPLQQPVCPSPQYSLYGLGKDSARCSNN